MVIGGNEKTMEEEDMEKKMEEEGRRRWSLLVKIEGNPLNTQHAQHQEEEEDLFVIVHK